MSTNTLGSFNRSLVSKQVAAAYEQNERALAVYESAGYRRDGSVRESDFGGTTIRELRLVKQL